MRCPHCGEEMPDYDEEFKFCPSCGMRLESVSDVLAGNASPVSLEKAGLVSPVSLEKEESESTVSPEETETASPVSLEKEESESIVSPEEAETVSPVSLEKEESESTVSPEEEETVIPVSLEKEESAGTVSPEEDETVSPVSLENEETATPASLEAAKTEDDLKSFQEEQIRLAAKELELRKALRAERERQAREERIRLSKVAPEWWETETEEPEVKSEARPESNSAVNPEVRSQAQPETKPGAMPQAKTEAARSGKKLLTKREEEEERQKKRRKSNRRYALITVIVALLTAAAVSFVYLNRNSTQTISVSDGTAVKGGASASDGTAVKGGTTASDETAVKGGTTASDGTAAKDGASPSGGTAAESAAVESAPQNGNTAQESQPAGQAGADPASGAAEPAADPAADPAAGGTQEAVIISYPASFAVSNLGFNNEELGLNDVDNERTDTFVVTDGFFSYEEGEEDTYLFWDDEMAERAFFSASDYEIPEVLIGGDLAMAYCDAVMTGKMTGRYMPSATEFYELDWANRLLILTSGTGAGHTETVTRGEFIYQENGAISKVVYTYEGSDETDTVEFTYDENDRLIYVGDRDVIYDEDTGKVSRIERDGNVEKEFSYDEAGILSTETEYFYDEDGEESGSTVFSYTFDESGRLVSLSAENYALMGGTNAYVFTYGEI